MRPRRRARDPDAGVERDGAVVDPGPVPDAFVRRDAADQPDDPPVTGTPESGCRAAAVPGKFRGVSCSWR
ncbi:MAG: hypothetical protein R3F43_03750 [bacterium]